MQYTRNAYLIFASSLLLCLQWLVAGVAASAPGSAPVDLLAALRLDQHEAVVKTTGICETREGHKGADTAYKLVKKSVISVPTATVFPGGFPDDFSILSVFRTSGRSRG